MRCPPGGAFHDDFRNGADVYGQGLLEFAEQFRVPCLRRRGRSRTLECRGVRRSVAEGTFQESFALARLRNFGGYGGP